MRRVDGLPHSSENALARISFGSTSRRAARQLGGSGMPHSSSNAPTPGTIAQKNSGRQPNRGMMYAERSAAIT